MSVLIKNNASSRLAAPINKTSTQLVLAVNGGEKFPLPTSDGEWFPLTVVRSNGQLEIMRCTQRQGDVLTVERAQEDTLPKEFSVGDRVELRLTANTFRVLFGAQDQLIEQRLTELDDRLSDQDSKIADFLLDNLASMHANALSF